MFVQVKAIHLGIVFAAAAILITAGIISAQQPSQEDSVRSTANELLASLNAEDLAAVAGALDRNIVIEGFGFCPGDKCAGINAVQDALELAVDEDVRIRTVPGTERVHGKVWLAEVEVRADSITNGGAERLLYQLEIEVESADVVRMRFVAELDDAETARFLGTGTPASPGPRPIQAPSTGSGGLKRS